MTGHKKTKNIVDVNHSALRHRHGRSRWNYFRSGVGLALGLVIAVLPQLVTGGDIASAAPADAEISGIVSESGDVTRNVVVTAYRQSDDGDSYQFEQETYSDSDGKWTLSGLPDGDYTLAFDTSHSTARFALGETLGGQATVTSEEPQFSIENGSATSDPYSTVEFQRLGGEISLSVVGEDGTPFIDLDDAAANVSGITRAGEPWKSDTFWSDADGTIMVSRVPSGGYIPYFSVAGNDFEPAEHGIVVTREHTTEVTELRLPDVAESEFDSEGALSLEGMLKSGEQVKAAFSAPTPEPASTEFAWVAGNIVLSGENSAKLTLTDDQVGDHVAVWAFSYADGYEPTVAFAQSEEAVVAADASTAPTEDPEDSGDDESTGSGTLPWTGPVGITLLILLALVLLGTGLALYARKRSSMTE